MFEMPNINSEEEIEAAAESLLEMLTPAEVLERVIGVGADAFERAAVLFCTLIALVLICAVLRALCMCAANEGLASGVTFVCAAVICSAVAVNGYGALGEVSEYFERLGSLMSGMIPTLGAAWAMGGNIGTASVGSASLYAMLSFVGGVCATSVMPVCYVSGAAAVCSSLSGGSVLDGFCRAVKRIYTATLGLLMTLFVFALGAQTSIAAAADTAALRSGKVLSSVIIPNVGGAVGESLRVLAGSVSYIKNVVGVGGIVLLISATLPTAIWLILCRLAFLLTSTLASALGCEREGNLLSELGHIYGLLVGAVCVCAVSFTVALSLFVKCTVAVG